jgi:signal transduction histidine kinase
LNEVAGDVVELIGARAADADVELAWKPADSIPTLTFDPDAIHRAILNVITNAIDACEKVNNGRVSVSTIYIADETRACILVEDNGEGIAPDDIKRIFSVFESRKGSRGTGLGLPVSQKIMQEHGGNIRVESTPNAGSRFFLELPAILAAATKAAETLTEPLQSPQT